MLEYIKTKVVNIMAIIYENVIPALIENTTMQKVIVDGVHTTYMIYPADGYVLHDNRVDVPVLDPITYLPTDEIMPMFKMGGTSVRYDYDFSTVTNGSYTYTDENNMEVTINVLKVGEYEFYAVPADIVPSDQKFDVGNNDHEVM